tara:strand:- start:105 stop:431 length:327 start_codon:yes stop_codon:yes gene_type:complete
MAAKKLDANSKYAILDTDGDGIVSDEEMDRHERITRLENEDKQQDQQRAMAWIAMSASLITVIFVLTPIINLERMATAGAFLNTFIVAQVGIVAAFMGSTAFSKTKLK